MKAIKLYCLLIFLISCQALGERQQKKYTSPKGYRMDQPERFRVRESMQEISGLVYYGDEDHFIAMNDEQGKLFQISLRTKRAYPSWKFGKDGDYEEVLFTGKDWLVLKSNGTLYHVHHLFTDSTSSTPYHFPKDGLSREFEAAYYDSSQNTTFVICKNCEADKGKGVTSVYAFPMDSKKYIAQPAYQISAAGIPELNHDLRPSGVAIHPIEKRLYIVCSINKLLVITDMNGKVQEYHHLPRRTFNQPEGIAFAPNGDMYISNEGNEDKTADILKFIYQPQP